MEIKNFTQKSVFYLRSEKHNNANINQHHLLVTVASETLILDFQLLLGPILFVKDCCSDKDTIITQADKNVRKLKKNCRNCKATKNFLYHHMCR